MFKGETLTRFLSKTLSFYVIANFILDLEIVDLLTFFLASDIPSVEHTSKPKITNDEKGQNMKKIIIVHHFRPSAKRERTEHKSFLALINHKVHLCRKDEH
jgi:hypothetical protein